MTNPDTTSPQTQPPTAAPAPTDPIPPVKPGYMTTEFWLTVVAFALSALYASGALTNSVALAIAGIAATVLGSLGYKVSRTLVKTAAVLALVVLALGSGSMLCACATAKADVTKAEHAIVDCTKLEAPQLEVALLQVAVDAVTYALKLGHIDWSALEATAENDGSDIATCAFVEYRAAQSTTVSRVASAAPAPDPSAAALERLRGKLGGPVWHTAHGDI
jgi:hypothetical protein